MNEYRIRQRFHIVTGALNGVFLGGLYQYLGFTSRRLGATVGMIAMLTALPRIANLTAFLYAHRFDHIPSTMRNGVPQIVCCLVFAGLAATAGPLAFVWVAIIGSFFLAAGNTFYGGLLADLYPATHRGRFLAMPLAATMLTTILMNLAAGRLLDAHPESYRAVFLFCATAGVAAGLVIAKIPIADVRGETEHENFWKETVCVLRDRSFLSWTILYSLTAFPYWLAVPAFPVFFNDELGLSYAAFGLTQIALNGSMLLAFMGGGRLIDRYGSPVMMGIAWFGLAGSLFGLSASRSLGMAAAAQALHGACMGINDIAWYPVILEFAPRKKIGAYMGVYVTFAGLRSLIGSWLGGVLVNSLGGDSRTALFVAAAMTMPGCLLIIINLKRLNAGREQRAMATEGR